MKKSIAIALLLAVIGGATYSIISGTIRNDRPEISCSLPSQELMVVDKETLEAKQSAHCPVCGAVIPQSEGASNPDESEAGRNGLCPVCVLMAAPSATADELRELLPQYKEIMGTRLTQFPVMNWRDELQELSASYDAELAQRKADQELQDGLSKEQAGEFHQLRTLFVWQSFGNCAGREPEFILAVMPQTSAGNWPDEERIQAFLDALKASPKQKGVPEALERLLATTTLPPALIDRARTDGTMEARQSILEESLNKVEPSEARPLGHRIQVLRHLLAAQ